MGHEIDAGPEELGRDLPGTGCVERMPHEETPGAPVHDSGSARHGQVVDGERAIDDSLRRLEGATGRDDPDDSGPSEVFEGRCISCPQGVVGAEEGAVEIGGDETDRRRPRQVSRRHDASGDSVRATA